MYEVVKTQPNNDIKFIEKTKLLTFTTKMEDEY